MEDTNTTKEQKVFQLCQELEDIKDKKKDSMKAFNEEIKRLQEEIKDLIEPEEQE
jgi:gas vesicle protein